MKALKRSPPRSILADVTIKVSLLKESVERAAPLKAPPVPTRPVKKPEQELKNTAKGIFAFSFFNRFENRVSEIKIKDTPKSLMSQSGLIIKVNSAPTPVKTTEEIKKVKKKYTNKLHYLLILMKKKKAKWKKNYLKLIL